MSLEVECPGTVTKRREAGVVCGSRTRRTARPALVSGAPPRPGFAGRSRSRGKRRRSRGSRTFPSPMPTPAYMRIAPVYDGCRRYRYGPSTTSCWSAATWRLRVKCAPSVRIAHQRRATPDQPYGTPQYGPEPLVSGQSRSLELASRGARRERSPAICHTSSCQYVGSDHRRLPIAAESPVLDQHRPDRSSEHEQVATKLSRASGSDMEGANSLPAILPAALIRRLGRSVSPERACGNVP